jgi:hypothetical protein
MTVLLWALASVASITGLIWFIRRWDAQEPAYGEIYCQRCRALSAEGCDCEGG